MNLTTGTPSLRSLLQSLVLEASGDVGLFPAGNADLDIALNVAYQELYAEIVEKAPSFFAERSADKTTSATGTYAYGGTALHARGTLALVRVELKRVSGEYVPLDPVDDYNELRWPGVASMAGTEPTHYAVLGFTVYCYPELASAATLRLAYVPNRADLAASSEETPFGGNLPQFHHLIAYRAALNALTKDAAPERVQQAHDRVYATLMHHVQRRQVQRSRMVRMTDPEAS